MDKLVTLEMITTLPNLILNDFREQSQYNVLLSKDVYDMYDTKELKAQIVKCFNRYNETVYLYRFPTTISSYQFEPRENMLTNRYCDKTCSTASKEIDKLVWITDFYNCLLRVTAKLTEEEIQYLIGTFFRKQTEEALSEKMHICRNTLRGIKKSCLVKLWVEISLLMEEC